MATKEEPVQEVTAPLPCGAVIQGRYIVESLLGKGGFGTIYLVRDQHKKQKLFVLAEVFNPNGESYRFTLVYVAPESLDHQMLPRVQYVFNDDKLGRAYVLMSSIEEPTLEILRLQQPEKRFPLPKVIAFMVPVINVLNYLHHQNPPVIHQNINPTNIIVSQTLSAPVLIMLELVKECNSTTTTFHCFAPGYGAPEQYRKEISIRSDIYALGATCYTLLTGIIPPDSLYRSTQLNKGEVDPLRPLGEVIPTIPAVIVEAIQRSMSLNADDRFSSVQQFERALIGDLRFQKSPTLRLNGRLPKQVLSPKADLVEQKPLEPPVLEVVPSALTQSPIIPERDVKTLAESSPRQRHTMFSRKSATSRPASSRRAVKKSSATSKPKQSRTWKQHILFIVIAFIMSFGIAVVFWSDIPGYPVDHSGAPTQNAKAPKLTPTPPSVSSLYPILTGTYSGTIYDLSHDISTSMLLTGMSQSQGNISGYLTLGPKLQGSGHFSGTIDTSKELKFLVTDTVGNATLFFEGVMRSPTILTGDYYLCSPVSLSQGGQCKQAPGSYGIWYIVLLL